MARRFDGRAIRTLLMEVNYISGTAGTASLLTTVILRHEQVRLACSRLESGVSSEPGVAQAETEPVTTERIIGRDAFQPVKGIPTDP